MQLYNTPRQALVALSLATVAALFATSAILMLFLGGFKIIFAIISGLLFTAGLVACGNIRLFCLWGLILTAPLALNISFNIVAHMGGSSALTLDAMDLLLLPLIIFQLRDFVVGYRTRIRIPKVLYWWFGLIILGLITIAFGPMREVAFLEVVRMIKLSLLFIVLVNELVRVKQFEHVVAALLVVIAIQGIVALIQYIFSINLGAQILGEVTEKGSEFTSLATYNQKGEFTNRVGGLIGHPNTLAVVLAMILPIGISILFSGIKTIYKLLVGINVCIGIIALILTLSRSGWLGFSLAFVTLMGFSFLDSHLRRKYTFARIVSLVAIAFLAIALSGPIMKRLFQSDSGAVSFRWEFVGVSMDMVKDKPILGFGLNSFVWHMPPYTKHKNYKGVLDNFGENLPVVHNIYLLYWVEQGTIGLIFFLAFYFKLLRIGWEGLSRYKQPFLAMVNLGCFAGLLALMVDGMASFFIRIDNCGRIFFIVAALMVAIRWWQYENVEKPQLINKQAN